MKQSTPNPGQATNSKQKQVDPVMVKETFSIPMLERKMMFLNEPTLLNAPIRQGVDQVKHLWSVHAKQMEYHDESINVTKQKDAREDNKQALKQE